MKFQVTLIQICLILLFPLALVHAQGVIHVQTHVMPDREGDLFVTELGQIALTVGDQTMTKRFMIRYPDQAERWNGKLLIGAHAMTGGSYAWEDWWTRDSAERWMDWLIGNHAVEQGYAYASVDRDGIGGTREGLALTTNFTKQIQNRMSDTFQRPVQQTYLAGVSTGGTIARYAAESSDTPYDGIMIIAGGGGDTTTRLEREARIASLWPQIDPRYHPDIDKKDKRVKAFAKAVGTSEDTRQFWLYGGIQTSMDSVRSNLASMGLTELTDKQIQKFRVKDHRKNQLFMDNITAMNSTGRVQIPTIEIVGTYDDFVLSEVRAYQKKVQKIGGDAARARYRLYQVEGAWHLSGATRGNFAIVLRRKSVPWPLINAMWEGRPYIPMLNEALAQLDQWVAAGTPPPEDHIIPLEDKKESPPQNQADETFSIPAVLAGHPITDQLKQTVLQSRKASIDYRSNSMGSMHLLMMLIQNGDQSATTLWDKLNVDRNLLEFATELGVLEGVWDPDHFRRVIEVDWQVTTKQPVDGQQVHNGILEWIDTSQLALNVNGQSRVVPLDALIDGVINRNRDSEEIMNLSLDEFLDYQRGEWRVLTEDAIDGERMHVGTFHQENGNYIQIRIGETVRTIPLNQINRMAIKKPARNQAGAPNNNPWIEPEYYHVLKTALLEAQRLEAETIDTGHLLLAITKMHRSAAARLLAEFDVTYETLISSME